jgi:guanylate kinase|tara:strand:- start:6712 stop:7284 length:573 start_codon:yes stop_codon:yes gene_type:complete
MSKGKCIIFSAPSGSGKTTLVKHLLDQKDLNLIFSISATTRKKRGNERNGVDYNFLEKEIFDKKIKKGEFLEFEEVYKGVLYGTLKQSIENLLKDYNVIFDIDVEGGVKLKNIFKDNALSVFVKPPSLDELKKRLNIRNKDSKDSINIRISKANFELSKEKYFDQTIINDDLLKAKKEAYIFVNQFLEKQ